MKSFVSILCLFFVSHPLTAVDGDHSQPLLDWICQTQEEAGFEGWAPYAVLQGSGLGSISEKLSLGTLHGSYGMLGGLFFCMAVLKRLQIGRVTRR